MKMDVEKLNIEENKEEETEIFFVIVYEVPLL